MEYYGIELLSLFADTNTGAQRRRNATPTDPSNPDTDGDLLLDGYELLYGSDPLTFRTVTLDSDGDGLTDLQEQIFGTNLFQNDTDIDGVSDAVEISDGSNPVDDTDFFLWNRSAVRTLQAGGVDDACNPRSNSARIRLSVGDPSSSQSERYKIIIDGVVAHESPFFGKVDSGDYTIPAGVYTVRVKHVASKRTTPDYDYFAAITSLESTLTWRILINDTSRILGSHSESNYDYTVGRSATLSVIRAVPGSSVCEQHTTCFMCRSDTNCRWDEVRKRCSDVCSLPQIIEKKRYISPETCPCLQCERWYQIEKDRSRQWIEELPICPCRVRVVGPTIPFFGRTSLSVDNSQYTWTEDFSCNPESANDCARYHPGAYGCIRSESTNEDSYSGQQCCYNSTGRVISRGVGAGSPDLVAGTASNFLNPFAPSHDDLDVDPWENCCMKCSESEVCALYVGSDDVVGVRQDIRKCTGPE